MVLEKQTLGKSAELTNEYIYDMAVRVSTAAMERKLPIKLLGATAFINRCPNHRDLYFGFGRRLTDVDVVTYGSVKTEIVDGFFADLGFEKQQHYIWHASTRDIFIGSDGLLLDVFRDKLDFCHTIYFKNRLDGPWLTIPLEEMLLQKLQIVTINDKDLKDLAVLFLEHEITPGSSDGIDASYIASLFAKNWGFFHTATTNLKKFHRYLKNIGELTKEDKVVIRDKINKLLSVIDAEPKSLGWKLRSKIGTKIKWYNEVEEIER